MTYFISPSTEILEKAESGEPPAFQSHRRGHLAGPILSISQINADCSEESCDMNMAGGKAGVEDQRIEGFS